MNLKKLAIFGMICQFFFLSSFLMNFNGNRMVFEYENPLDGSQIIKIPQIFTPIKATECKTQKDKKTNILNETESA